MAKITRFAQVIQKLPKELIKSLIKNMVQTNMSSVSPVGATL